MLYLFRNLTFCGNQLILLPRLVSKLLIYVLSFFVVVLLCCQAREYAETLENAVWTNQFDNRANRKAHYETTGPEIWQQTGGWGYSDVEKMLGVLLTLAN